VPERLIPQSTVKVLMKKAHIEGWRAGHQGRPGLEWKAADSIADYERTYGPDGLWGAALNPELAVPEGEALARRGRHA
jgi:hypothetical protein